MRKSSKPDVPVRLVLDTNVIISAALKADGLPRTVLVLALTKPARLYVSNAILAEYREVLARKEFKIPRRHRKSRRQATRTTICFWNAPTQHGPTT